MSEGWNRISVGHALTTHFSGAWGTDPKNGATTSTVLRSTDIDDDGHVDLGTGATRQLSARERNLKALKSGDILLEASGGGPGKPVGRPAWFRSNAPGNYTVSNFFRVLRPDPLKVDGRFLLWKLLHLSHRPEIWQFQQQTTGIINLKLGDYLQFGIDIPPLSQQRIIAEILDGLDDQIRATEQVLLKLEFESRAALTALMTRGLPASHRGSRQATEGSLSHLEEQDLPRGWHLASIESMLAAVQPAMRSGPFGSALLKHELVSSGIPLLGIDNVHTDRFDSSFTRFVTPEKAQQLSRYLVRPSDIMITIMGTVGRCCLVPEGIGDALSSKHVWTITLDQDRYLPYLACKQLNHAPWARAHLRRDEQGGIMGAIRSETLRTLMLPVPPIEEQREISEILKAIDRRISAESEKLAKLRPLKNGLMSDLLTGRVRVPAEVAS